MFRHILDNIFNFSPVVQKQLSSFCLIIILHIILLWTIIFWGYLNFWPPQPFFFPPPRPWNKDDERENSRNRRYSISSLSCVLSRFHSVHWNLRIMGDKFLNFFFIFSFNCFSTLSTENQSKTSTTLTHSITDNTQRIKKDSFSYHFSRKSTKFD